MQGKIQKAIESTIEWHLFDLKDSKSLLAMREMIIAMLSSDFEQAEITDTPHKYPRVLVDIQNEVDGLLFTVFWQNGLNVEKVVVKTSA